MLNTTNNVLCCSKNICSGKNIWYIHQTYSIANKSVCVYFISYVVVFLCGCALSTWQIVMLNTTNNVLCWKSQPIFLITTTFNYRYLLLCRDRQFYLSHYFSLTMAVPFISYSFNVVSFIRVSYLFFFTLILLLLYIYIYLFIINTVLNVHHHRSVLEWSNSSIPSTSK